MIKNAIDLSQALELGSRLPFAWIRSLSSVYIGKNKSIDGLLEEIDEVRFFDPETEVKIVRQGETLQAWHICLKEDDRIIEKSYTVQSPEFGGKIRVAWILASDEDGQTYICDEKLSGWEENGTWTEMNQ